MCVCASVTVCDCVCAFVTLCVCECDCVCAYVCWGCLCIFLLYIVFCLSDLGGCECGLNVMWFDPLVLSQNPQLTV